MDWVRPNLAEFLVEWKETYNTKPKVFISGAITSRLETYKKYFDKAEAYLLNFNCEVYNPSVIPISTSWESAMAITLDELKNCDVVYVLKGWEDSEGVKKELEIAKERHIKIFFE